MSFVSAISCLLATFSLVYSARAANVRFPDNSSNVFGGLEAVFHITATDAPEGARMAWQLAMGGHVVARREQSADAPELRVPVPTVNEGVVGQAVLTVTLLGSSGTEALSTVERTLWIYPDDPWANSRETIKKLPIQLFDPAGDTAARFEESSLPFQRVKSVDALGSLGQGLVIIGAGCSWDEYKALPETMVKLAEGGVDVLCLAPQPGHMALPGSADTDAQRPTRLLLSDGSFVTQLDKKLDVPGSAGFVRIASQRDAVFIDVSATDAGWMWLEADYGTASLMICAADIVGAWQAGPTPRFLLARLIESLTQKEDKE